MKEGQRAKLHIDDWNYILLDITYVESNIVFLCSDSREAFYKYDKRKEKLYKWNNDYSTWDNSEYTISLLTENDIWNDRKPKLNFYGD